MFRLADLVVLQDYQVRESVDESAIESYREAVERGEVLPPLVAYRLEDRRYGKRPVLFIGHHRYAALRRAGVTHHPVEIREGTYAAAWAAAWADNRNNPVQYTNADKKKGTREALLLFRGESDGSIAKRIGVSRPFVSEIRARMVSDGLLPAGGQVIGSDGKTYQRRTQEPAQVETVSTWVAPVEPVGGSEVEGVQATPVVPEPAIGDAQAFTQVSTVDTSPALEDMPSAVSRAIQRMRALDEAEAAREAAIAALNEPGRPTFDEWQATMPVKKEKAPERPSGPPESDNPYWHLMRACTELKGLFQDEFKNDPTGVLLEGLTHMRLVTAKLPWVVFHSGKIVEGKATPPRAEFVGIDLTRRLVRKLGKIAMRKQKPTLRAIKAAVDKIVEEASQGIDTDAEGKE